MPYPALDVTSPHSAEERLLLQPASEGKESAGVSGWPRCGRGSNSGQRLPSVGRRTTKSQACVLCPFFGLRGRAVWLTAPPRHTGRERGLLGRGSLLLRGGRVAGHKRQLTPLAGTLEGPRSWSWRSALSPGVRASRTAPLGQLPQTPLSPLAEDLGLPYPLSLLLVR